MIQISRIISVSTMYDGCMTADSAKADISGALADPVFENRR